MKPDSPTLLTLRNSTATLVWAVNELARLQGIPMDASQLLDAQSAATHTESLDSTYAPEGEYPDRQIQRFCQHLGWSAPVAIVDVDPVQFPILGYAEQQGWFVGVDMGADGSLYIRKAGLHTTASSSIVAPAELKMFTRLWCISALSSESGPAPTSAWKLIKNSFFRFKPLLLQGALASVLINIVGLLVSLFSMQVYDRVIPSQGYNTLAALWIGVVLAIAFEAALKWARSHLMEYVVVNMDDRLSRHIFDRLLQIRLDQLPQSVGSLAGQLRAYEGIRTFMTASTAYVLVDVPFALFFLLFIGIIGSPWVALVPMVFWLASLAAGFATQERIAQEAKQSARTSHEKTGLLVEALEGAETIKSGRGRWKFSGRWQRVSQASIRHELTIRHLSEMSGYWAAAFQQLSYASLIAVGAWQVMEGHMTVGALVACSILSGRVLAPVGLLTGLWVQYAHAKAALGGLEAIYRLRTDPTESSPTENAGEDGAHHVLLPEQIRGHYRLEGVVFSYPRLSLRPSSPGTNIPDFEGPDPNQMPIAQSALHIDKLHISPAEKVVILGPVGSGKSTLLKLLAGLYQPRQGRILLDDLDLNHISRQRLFEHVGYLQQEHRLFQGSLRENLLIGLPDPGDDSLMEAARQSGLIQVIREHPMGLDLPISEGGKGLSGGQRQLAALTRLLLTRPNIWLLDEPTASLGGPSEEHILRTLKTQIKPEHTLVLVTHKPTLVPLADRIIVLNQNSILLDGPRDDVLHELIRRGKAQGHEQRSGEMVVIP